MASGILVACGGGSGTGSEDSTKVNLDATAAVAPADVPAADTTTKDTAAAPATDAKADKKAAH